VSEPAVEVVDLIKRYPKRPTNAVDGVDFQVPPGEIFGPLGPNGAGKTTTVGILTTRVVPSSGIARVRGVDVTENPVLARSMLSVVPQRPNLDFALNARQILLFHAAYHGVDVAERNRRADALLEQFGLTDRGGVAFLVLGSLSLSWSDAPMVAVFLVLGSLVGSAVGLTLGTFVEPQRMQLVFALVLTPLLFTGSVQFPWPALDHLRWFQVLSALNPMTYLSEGLRGEMIPETPHIAT
jgi:hypothetical protein